MSFVTITEPYIVGEIPSPLEYQFLDAAGTPINVSGWAAELHIQEKFGTATVLTASVSDGPNGKVRHVFSAGELTTPGSYRAQFWAGNGVNRYASVDIKFTVATSVGTAPAI